MAVASSNSLFRLDRVRCQHSHGRHCVLMRLCCW